MLVNNTQASAFQPPLWAVMGAALGDTRRTARVVSLAACLGDRPAASVPAACGTWAATKAAYRFFGNVAVDPSDVLAAHREACINRISGRPLVLAVQDTSVYNFTTHRATRGLGPLATHGAQSLAGFMVHTCLAVSPEGVPLGVLGQKLWVRPEREGRVPPKHHDHRPVAEKESVRWQAMLEESTRNLPLETRVLTIADREADIIDFFVAAIQRGQDFLVRAAYNRKLHNQDGYVWDAVERAEPVGYQILDVPRGHDQPGRKVELELRIASITLRPPTHRRELPPVPLRAVLARERNPLPDQEGR